jgi:TonB family protein
MAASERDDGAPRRTQSSARRPPAPVGAGRPQLQRLPAARQPAAVGGGFAARVFGLLGISLGSHMALLAVLGFMPSPAALLKQQVEMEILAEEPPPPPPPPAAEPPKPLEPPEARPKAPKAAPKIAEPTPPKAEPKPTAEAPVDLTGVTLTGGDGSSWSSVVGNGSALNGPAARIGRTTGNNRAGSNDGAIGGQGKAPALVNEASLSRKPIPPEGMDALLLQYYPARARAQGVAGSAMLRVRILADGRVGDMRLVRESDDYGFGDACMKLLRLRRWQAPLDRHGQPVSTEISYLCEFEVGN